MTEPRLVDILGYLKERLQYLESHPNPRETEYYEPFELMGAISELKKVLKEFED